MIQRVDNVWDAAKYQEIFTKLSGVRLPFDYILLSKSYLLCQNNIPIGGFIVANQDHSRCAAQIPDTPQGRLAR
jgi:hypothetical protein